MHVRPNQCSLLLLVIGIKERCEPDAHSLLEGPELTRTKRIVNIQLTPSTYMYELHEQLDYKYNRRRASNVLSFVREFRAIVS